MKKLPKNDTANPAPIPTNPKLAAIRLAMDQIEKQYGKGSIMKLGESAHKFTTEVIPTGSIALDLALGAGGVPRGRIIEIYGPEASGKTTICLHIIAEAQKLGGTAAFIDAEHALDPLWAGTIGVNLDDLLISQPDTGEQALEIAETLIRSGAIDVLVIDSVAALVPRAEIEGEMGDSMIGVQARLMSQALRKLTGVISKSKTVCIFTNQLRQKIGVMFGNPETTPGGRALKFYSSVRIDVRKIAQVKKGEEIVGSQVKAKVVKNKVAPPFRVAEFFIMWGEGISYEADVLTAAIKYGIVKKSGSTLSFNNEKIAVGLDNAKNKLKEDKKLLEEIKKETKEKMTSPS